MEETINVKIVRLKHVPPRTCVSVRTGILAWHGGSCYRKHISLDRFQMSRRDRDYLSALSRP